MENLIFLDISSNPIITFSLSRLPVIEILNCSNCSLESITGISLSLKMLDCSSTNIRRPIDAPNLSFLNISDTPYRLVYSMYPKLTELISY